MVGALAFSRRAMTHALRRTAAATFSTATSSSQITCLGVGLKPKGRRSLSYTSRHLGNVRETGPSDFGILISAVAERHTQELSLVQVGSFYEAHGAAAEELSLALGMTLTRKAQRMVGDSAARMYPMCGFPVAQLDRHVQQLVKVHRRNVAVYDQYHASPLDKTLMRRLRRIYTPGTLFELTFTRPDENSFLMAIAPSDNGSWSLAYTDVSTGELRKDTVPLDLLEAEIYRIDPKEIVASALTKEDPPLPLKNAINTLNVPFVAAATSEQSKLPFCPAPLQLLQDYLKQVLPLDFHELGSPATDSNERLHLSPAAVAALEIKQTVTGAVPTAKGSLLSSIRRTSTAGGARLLSQTLCAPFRSLEAINQRLDVVDLLVQQDYLRNDLRAALKLSPDAARICNKFANGRSGLNDIREMLLFCRSLNEVASASDIAAESMSCSDRQVLASILANTLPDVGDLECLQSRLQAVLDHTPGIDNDLETTESTISEEGGMTAEGSSGNDRQPVHFAPDASPELAQAWAQLHALEHQKCSLEASLVQSFRPNKIELVYDQKLAKPAVRVNSPLRKHWQVLPLRSTKSYGLYDDPQWTTLFEQLATAEKAKQLAESRVLSECSRMVRESMEVLKRAYMSMDHLDVCLSHATMAAEMGYVRPVLDTSKKMAITEGRHPTIELACHQSGRDYMSNDLQFSSEATLAVITGSNMGGKSTYLRQNALIVLMAQSGSFVPAKAAHIGIVDQIFTRIGASDDTVRNKSTFMQEMSDVADILKHATPRSLVLIDELGRGTSHEDGVALSVALCEQFIYQESRTIMTTHIHELTTLLQRAHKEKVQMLCTEVLTDQRSRAFRVTPGINPHSAGIATASLAGIPLAVVEQAKRLKDR